MNINTSICIEFLNTIPYIYIYVYEGKEKAMLIVACPALSHMGPWPRMDSRRFLVGDELRKIMEYYYIILISFVLFIIFKAESS